MILFTVGSEEGRVMKWHYAAATKGVMFATFDIDVFIFTYLDTVQLC